MDVIIDIQFFKDNKGGHIPKEVALTAVGNEFSSHWIVSPPTRAIEKLSKNIKKQNEWLTQNHHGLDYFDGDVPIRVLTKSLRELCRSVRKIYVRGVEKVYFLKRITTREIINLEHNDECPPFENLPWADNYCFQHGAKPTHLRNFCALNNTIRLKLWLLEHKSDIGNIDLESTIEICNNEQPGSSSWSLENHGPYGRCVSSGPYTESLDETDGICA